MGFQIPTVAEVMEYPLFYGVIIVLITIVLIRIINGFFEADPLGRTAEMFSTFQKQEGNRNIKVDEKIEAYNNLQKGADDKDVEKRNSSYAALVDAYYELATLFYEWGWGQSFHFAYQLPGEKFLTSIQRHEYYLAGRLGVKPGDAVLDCGCGIGGPMRNIAKFTKAKVTGVTINEYQVLRGNELNVKAGLKVKAKEQHESDSATSVQADFMKLPFKNNSFDGVYAIEATCHAPQREGVYNEIFRVLKPGQMFACYEWCLTPKYEKDNEYHQKIKKKIEEGDGLPDMATQDEVVRALQSCGFEIVEYRDMALDEQHGGDPWWLPLWPSWNPFTFRFQFNPIGLFLTRNFLWLIEKFYLAPEGSYKVQEMLQQGGWGCAHGGHTGTFTPMFLMVARKPANIITVTEQLVSNVMEATVTC